MSEKKIQPALTPEEWKEPSYRLCERRGYREGLGDAIGEIESSLPEERHTVAALCLHGQPFGFTREDVEAAQRAAGNVGRKSLEVSDREEPILTDLAERLWSLADRIQALLPPEKG